MQYKRYFLDKILTRSGASLWNTWLAMSSSEALRLRNPVDMTGEVGIPPPPVLVLSCSSSYCWNNHRFHCGLRFYTTSVVYKDFFKLENKISKVRTRLHWVRFNAARSVAISFWLNFLINQAKLSKKWVATPVVQIWCNHCSKSIINV